MTASKRLLDEWMTRRLAAWRPSCAITALSGGAHRQRQHATVALPSQSRGPKGPHLPHCGPCSAAVKKWMHNDALAAKIRGLGVVLEAPVRRQQKVEQQQQKEQQHQQQQKEQQQQQHKHKQHKHQRQQSPMFAIRPKASSSLQ